MEVWHFTHRVSTPIERHLNGTTVHHLPFPKLGNRLEITKNLRWMPQQSRAWINARSSSVDLLHLHSVYQPANLWVAALLHVPYVVTPHGGYNPAILAGRRRLGKKLWFELFERRLLSRASIIQLLTPMERAGLESLRVTTPVTFIPNGLDDALLAMEPTAVPRSGHLLFLGRLDVSVKGLDLLLRAYAAARNTTPEISRLVLAGPDSRGGLATLQKLAAKLHIVDSVTFAGAVYGAEKYRLVLEASLVVQTSRTEGLPLSLLEAMALGRPVLVTPGTNLSDEVASNNVGFTAEATVESIAAGLSAAAALPERDLNRMGSSAADLARERYRWSIVASQLVDVYRRILL